ncbi:MAG: hypothetical protein KGL39_10155 [Patescibacteria group bacterium]|nr:hypothetical protein [Patescibacteria group bacterium]
MGTLRTILVVALVFGGVVASRAADFLLVNNQFIHVYTNSLSFTGTNNVTVTNSQTTAASIYHTFHFIYTTTGTNTCNVVTERTVDSQNYFPVVTNSFSANSVAEATYTGKWVSYRFRATFLATNSASPTLVIPYVAQ